MAWVPIPTSRLRQNWRQTARPSPSPLAARSMDRTARTPSRSCGNARIMSTEVHRKRAPEGQSRWDLVIGASRHTAATHPTAARPGHCSRSLAMFEKARAGYTASGDVVGQRQTMRFIGQTHLDLGNHDAARIVLKAAEAVAGALGDGRDHLIAQTRYWLGQACLAARDIEGAETAFTAVADAFPHSRRIGHPYAPHGLRH